MKRYGNIYSKIYDMDNLKEAHRCARRDKAFYSEVKMVDKNPEFYLSIVQNVLKNKTYTIKPTDYTRFIKNDSGKEREIFKLDYFPHRIIQWAIMIQIQDIMLRSFTADTYSAIKGRGIHLASRKLQRAMKEDVVGMKYCLKIDVKKYYPNIDREILKSLYRRKFKDGDLLWLLDSIIDSLEGGKGIAIGSLISQWSGNFYLSYFDHWIKEEKSIKHYFRYMDDMLIFSKSKTELHDIFKEIEEYMDTNLNLKIKENWQVFPTYIRGIDFVGYRHFPNYIMLRKTTAKKFKRQMVVIRKKCDNGGKLTYSEWCSVNSYNGWIDWCDDKNRLRLTSKYIKPLNVHSKRFYTENIRSGKSNKQRHIHHSTLLDMRRDDLEKILGSPV